VPQLTDLRDAALEIFRAALHGVDAREAVKRAVRPDGTLLFVKDTTINLATHGHAVYAIAIGKAAHAMASALDETLGEKLTAGIVAGPPLKQSHEESTFISRASSSLSDRWRVFACGHPLPDEGSLAAARAAFEILSRAEEKRALVIFLISGGGSALIECARDESVTLAELQAANRVLINCGASIAEINAVRRAISAVKGGGLSSRAPHAAQLTLIISDTNKGEEANVGSGPTVYPPPDAPDAASVIKRYQLARHLPASILRSISQSTSHTQPPRESLRAHYVLLANEDAVASAAREALERGLIVEVAHDIVEQEIADGCTQLLERLVAAHRRASGTGRIVCLISGGEFACPVRGDGIGGRNSETALRLALEIEARKLRLHGDADSPSHIVALSAGTDGIDGNSRAAGAFSDETTIERAQMLGLDARLSLQTSDAFTFFEALGDALMTGPTLTNVRDIRILLAG
jgi:hydroxypyruvate reductase